MQVNVYKHETIDGVSGAAGFTLRPGQKSRLSFEKALQCEHSPIRVVQYQIQMIGVPTFVSVHFVRHKFGVEHFVTSNRDDRGGEIANRVTPVNHMLVCNAQALVNMSRKRLCFNAHRTTVGTMVRIRKAVHCIDTVMAAYMVPECVYRNGLCPELKMCRVGLDAVLRMYRPWPGNRQTVGGATS